MKYIEHGSACTDCVMIIANDDASGMDDKQEKLSRDGIESIGEHLVVGEEQGFSWQRCDVCNGLAGDRHEVGYLVEGDPDPEDEDDEEDEDEDD